MEIHSEEENGVANESQALEQKEKRKGKHDKPKPWDDDPNIDHWKIEKFDPSWNDGGMLEVSSFSTLKEFVVACELNLVTTLLCYSFSFSSSSFNPKP